MAIPEGGYFPGKVQKGRYGPIFPKTPAFYGFSVVAKVIPGKEEIIRNHAKVMEKAIADNPTFLAPLKAHYLRWVIFTIKGESYMMYQGIFDTDFDKYCLPCYSGISNEAGRCQEGFSSFSLPE